MPRNNYEIVFCYVQEDAVEMHVSLTRFSYDFEKLRLAVHV